MSAVDVSYHEATESARVEQLGLSHLSIETGHLYLEDFAEGDRLVREQFERTAPWVEAASRRVRKRFGRGARISTCFLVDDYTPSSIGHALPDPAEVVDLLTATAGHYDFTIDYLAREAGCVRAGDKPYAGARELSPLADIVTGLIVEEAAVDANGSRPPTAQTGWLANGQRSPAVSVAMDTPDWQPPEEFGKWRHSVFVDVELWHSDPDVDDSPRVYSCALLSAVWQLLRLGVLRDAGRVVAKPYRFAAEETLPEYWNRLPSITQLTANAAPFAAYQALSILPPHYRGVEHAAEIIIDHLKFDGAVLAQTAERARAEPHPLLLPDNPARRMSYVYLDEVHVLLDSA